MTYSDEKDIAFKSLTGLNFLMLVTGTVFYVLGFGSNSWAVIEYKTNFAQWDVRQSLWQRCECSDMDSDRIHGKLWPMQVFSEVLYILFRVTTLLIARVVVEEFMQQSTHCRLAICISVFSYMYE